MSARDAVYAVYERRLRAHLEGLPVPRHVAIMVDGNRRWARAAGFDDVSQGHSSAPATSPTCSTGAARPASRT